MKENNELAIQSEQTNISIRELTPGVWGMINEMAPVMYKARLFGVSSYEQAAAIMLKGYEMGLSITASFELVQVVQGKPALSPRGALALILNSPKIKTVQVEKIMKADKFVGYSCFMERTNGFKFKAEFTLEDAKRAGLVKPGSGWENYPENMCQWRAIGFCADVVAPDITSGMTNLMKMPEQYGVSLSQEGDIIDGSFYQNSQQPEEKQETKSEQEITLDILVELYGAEEVMVANEGKIPGNQDELNAVALKLLAVES